VKAERSDAFHANEALVMEATKLMWQRDTKRRGRKEWDAALIAKHPGIEPYLDRLDVVARLALSRWRRSGRLPADLVDEFVRAVQKDVEKREREAGREAVKEEVQCLGPERSRLEKYEPTSVELEAESRPREVTAALGILDEAESGLPLDRAFFGEAFAFVRKEIEGAILKEPKSFAQTIQDGTPPRQWIWSAIANIAGDQAESGNHHVWRGVLNPLGLGQGFLFLYETALDELVKLNALSAGKAREQKKVLRRNLGGVG